MSGLGTLGVTVWPPYVGLATSAPGPAGGPAEGEPFEDMNYARGMIKWRTESDGTILGAAHVYVPKGIYTHIVFFSGPHRSHGLMGSDQLEHPVIFAEPQLVEIDPIRNQDRLPR